MEPVQQSQSITVIQLFHFYQSFLIFCFHCVLISPSCLHFTSLSLFTHQLSFFIFIFVTNCHCVFFLLPCHFSPFLSPPPCARVNLFSLVLSSRAGETNSEQALMWLQFPGPMICLCAFVRVGLPFQALW